MHRPPQHAIPIALALALALLLTPSAAFAAPCNSDTRLELSAPKQAAIGRRASVTVTNKSYLATLRNARVEMADVATSQVFFAAPIDNDIVLEGDKSQLFIQLDPGDGPQVVRLFWEFDDPYRAGTTCQGYAQAVVSPVTGQLPAVAFHSSVEKDTGDLAVVAKGGCSVTALTPVTVIFRRKNKRLLYSSPDPCTSPFRRRSGRIGGLGVTAKANTLVLRASGSSNHDTEARVEVRAADRVIARRWVTATLSRYSARRVYEGTDRFQNYCINESKKLYSSRLRLYCISPGFTYRGVTFSRKR